MSDLESTRVLGEPGRGVVAIGLEPHPLKDLFHWLVTGPWKRILAVYALVYFTTQALIGAGHYLIGPPAATLPRGAVWGAALSLIPGVAAPDPAVDWRAVADAALTGLQGFLRWLMLAVGSGIIFTKFSLLKPRVLFSKVAVIGPHEQAGAGRSLFFRMANERKNAIVDAKVQAMLVMDERGPDGEPIRRVRDLPLTRNASPLFTHAWTAIHPIGRDSPLAGHDARTLAAANAEVIVTMTGFDEDLLRTTHARHVYRAKAIRFGVRFREIVRVLPDGLRAVDYRKFHDVVPLEEPAPVRKVRPS